MFRFDNNLFDKKKVVLPRDIKFAQHFWFCKTLNFEKNSLVKAHNSTRNRVQKAYNIEIVNFFNAFFLKKGKKLLSLKFIHIGLKSFLTYSFLNQVNILQTESHARTFLTLINSSNNFLNINRLLKFIINQYMYKFFFKTFKIKSINKKIKKNEAYTTNIFFIKQNERIKKTLKYLFFFYRGQINAPLSKQVLSGCQELFLRPTDNKLAQQRNLLYRRTLSKLRTNIVYVFR